MIWGCAPHDSKKKFHVGNNNIATMNSVNISDPSLKIIKYKNTLPSLDACLDPPYLHVNK